RNCLTSREGEAYGRLSQPAWAAVFEASDPGFTKVPIELRQPFMDLRVVEFLLRLPELPWSARKYLLRRSLAYSLPREITCRPKTPLAGDPVFLLANQGMARLQTLLRALRGSGVLRPFVAEKYFLQMAHSSEINSLDLRPVSLGLWLCRTGE